VIATGVEPYEIHYWSIFENEIIKIFKGHTEEITNLEMNPDNDFFLTTSKDNTCRLWDLGAMHSSAKTIFELKEAKSPLVCNFNLSGLIFVIGFSASDALSRIKMFDTKKCEDDCFATLEFECPEIRMIKFD